MEKSKRKRKTEKETSRGKSIELGVRDSKRMAKREDR
jgi:hypothetical protein